eukprot:CAMPEP_0172165504 /NCGR_PEP_ID=MMETSP1050-20130122/8450_1 /TAXON_ID=233186 /ORGANISM="Cryptomonas curvata, Strain CCAP979/52" /LENGTH=192 /DNA_ID=CAMNT_0012835985 /DNA_START=159 /DNA_END=734 /DNA_ORIENTATION=-
MTHCSEILLISALLCVAASRNAAHESVANPSVLIRPSDSDFVEVIRGGDLATDIIVQLKNIKVPEEGYIVLNVGDQSIIMCPRSAESIIDCPNGDENLPNSSVFTFFGVELGQQRICVDLFGWDRVPLAHQCSMLVGSDRFMGQQESREYFTSNINQFNHETAMKSFWDTLVLKSADRQIFPEDAPRTTVHV